MFGNKMKSLMPKGKLENQSQKRALGHGGSALSSNQSIGRGSMKKKSLFGSKKRRSSRARNV